VTGSTCAGSVLDVLHYFYLLYFVLLLAVNFAAPISLG